MRTRITNLFILLIVLANAGCDQLTKNVARDHLAYGEPIHIIGQHLILTKVENAGAFLSTGDGMPASLKFIYLMLLPLIALFFGVYYLFISRHLPQLMVIGICFVIGGGLGNLYDRLLYGSVTDFIHIDFYVIKTGVFNLADVSIMIGIVMLLINLYTRRREDEEMYQIDSD